MRLSIFPLRKINSQEMQILEEKLTATLQPIQPRESFISDLKIHLISTENLGLDRPRLIKYSFFIFAGIFGGVVLIATGIRAIFTLFVTVGVIKHMRDQSRNTMTAQPVR
jgi:hypothetical protein